MGLGTDYLELVLRLRKLVPAWVESYVGPPELADAVDAGEAVSVGELQDHVQALTERVRDEEQEPDRKAWLLAQLEGISAALRWLSGEPLRYAELFKRCHGASVGPVPDRQFDQAHALLDCALPGRGSVGARYRDWRGTQLVPRERLKEGLTLLAREMRRRCGGMFDLPADEDVIWDLVTGEPWAGQADYLGQGRTRIKINTDFPISSARLLELVCHEAYPGHHTESVCKDASLIQAAGREELSVYVYPTPQGLVSEGLACYALHALLGGEAEQVAADCLRSAGIPYDHETAAAVREAETLLLPVPSNVLLMLDAGSSSARAREYARAWLLDDADQIDQSITSLEARSWRPYESCYPVGRALCSQYVAAHPGGFHDLLHRQLTATDLAR